MKTPTTKIRGVRGCVLYSSGFTLLETLVAISILMVAIVAPMTLATQALSVAYYARDQVTAYYLAQEGIEIVRSVRDHNILRVQAKETGVNIYDHFPPFSAGNGSYLYFTADALATPDNALVQCPMNTCAPLQTNGTFYSQNPSGSGWRNSIFTRQIAAEENLDANGNPSPDDILILVTVTWQESSYQTRSFTLTEDLYSWIAGS